MAWRRPGDKPLSEPMMVSLPTLMCVTRPQWVKTQRRRDEIAAILQTIYPNSCSCMKIIIFLWLICFDSNITLGFVPKGPIIWTKHQSPRLAAGADSNVPNRVEGIPLAYGRIQPGPANTSDVERTRFSVAKESNIIETPNMLFQFRIKTC